MIKIIRAVMVLAVLIGIPASARAQVVRVMSGVDNTGATSYIDVFEYDYVSEKPTFPGGKAKFDEFINKNRRYPKEAYDMGIQGRVTCWFIVNADGTVSNVSLLRSVHEILNEEALRVLRLMPPWNPGKHDGVPVPVRVVRSICFWR
ncbi:MAG: energy transducer TonB [Muribaculaceae bacterium]|nr:energy transducer TonB [Muribaculaceae bacterium]